VNGANIAGINFNATAVQHSATLNWGASDSPGVTIAGYNIYRSKVSGTSYVKINATLATGLTYTDLTVQSGQTYFFVATAVDASGNESPFSNEAQAVIP
jgi:fibronectin type 3 domain-containing protein